MEETVTVHVSVARPVVLMVRQSAPSFETRALKNWAVTNGTTVIVRTQTSRDGSISQQVNAKPEQENNFSPKTLARLNLLIMERTARYLTPAMQAGDATARQVALPITPWWPWIFFILCAGALWLERKLDFDW